MDVRPNAAAATRPAPRRLAPAVGLAAGLAAAVLGGCEADSWLYDRSVVGRWERTATTVPILTRITSIEGPEDEYFEISEVQPEDLIPELEEYRVGPGDDLEIILWDVPEEGRAAPYRRLVDTRGYVELPQIGRVFINGQTADEARQSLEQAIIDAGLHQDPLVEVTVLGRRQQRYTVLGSVAAAGPYIMPSADHRLLEALGSAGGFAESPPYIYVIRQVPLTPEAAGRPQPPSTPGRGPAQPGARPGDIIEELMGEPQPEEPPAPEDQPPPEIDLPEGGAAQPPPRAAAPAGPEGTWVFLNGEWVLVQAAPTEARPGEPPRERLFTQRIIRIPTRELAAGNARYNIVVRPGDIIRVPPPPGSTIFLGGQIARPGAYGLTQELTLMRVILAAGGLSAIAVPERTDLVRMVGPDRQAIVRLNLRAIFEGTQPDIFLKPNDMINVGTDFWALPMAVIRSGFRATYGFGFLLDRNFGNDVFGAPPIGDREGIFF